MGEGIQKFNYIKIDRKYLSSMEKGINSEDDEWVQNLIHIMEKVLKLKQRITYTYDFKLFNKYGNPSDTVSRGDWGGCSQNEGFIWINAKKHKKSPKQELANTVIHEMLHIKNPTKSESWIRKETEKYVAIGE